MELHDKVVVVTGASAGLGRAFSELLVAKEAHVYGLSRRPDTLEALRDTLGERFHPVPCDVTDEVQVKRAIESINREAGRLDVLINNAGLGKFGPVDTMPTEHWTVQMETNLGGVFRCTREAVPPHEKAERQDRLRRPYRQHRVDCRNHRQPAVECVQRDEVWPAWL